MSGGVAFERGPHPPLFLPIKRCGDETHSRFPDRVAAVRLVNIHENYWQHQEECKIENFQSLQNLKVYV